MLLILPLEQAPMPAPGILLWPPR